MESKGDKGIALFDLDHTLTSKDSATAFLKFTHGVFGFYSRMCLLIPFLLLRKFKAISSDRFNEEVLTVFYRGWQVRKLEAFGSKFAKEELPKMITARGNELIEEYKNRGFEVVVVTASFDVWVKDWCMKRGLKMISSKFEYDETMVTGKLEGKHCHGDQKVAAVKEIFNLSEFIEIHTFGNLPQDRLILGLGTQQFVFKKGELVS